MSRVNAVRIHKYGGPEELRYEEVEVGEPGPGEARVRHTAIGLNFTDIQYLIRGAHRISAGETILIQAAAGGLGLIMCQWASHLGARHRHRQHRGES
jgi:NADPH:quinone reductase-like Zn-dependent oxidoreductase